MPCLASPVLGVPSACPQPPLTLSPVPPQHLDSLLLVGLHHTRSRSVFTAFTMFCEAKLIEGLRARSESSKLQPTELKLVHCREQRTWQGRTRQDAHTFDIP